MAKLGPRAAAWLLAPALMLANLGVLTHWSACGRPPTSGRAQARLTRAKGQRGTLLIHIAFSRLCEHCRGLPETGTYRRHGRARHHQPRRGLEPHPGRRVARAAEAESRPVSATKPVCLSAAETREEVRAHRLLEPFAALKFAAAQRKAEALSAKLCHSGDEFIYEITLLHRDGRLVHVEMEAGTGKLIPRPPHESHDAHDAHEPPVKN